MKAPVMIIEVGAEQAANLSGLNHDDRRRTRARLRKRPGVTHLRAVTLDDVPEGSLLSEETVAKIQAGKLTFAKQDSRPSNQLSAKERARIGRLERLANLQVSEIPVLSSPVPWIPLITPVPRAELDRLQEVKRLVRRARKGKS